MTVDIQRLRSRIEVRQDVSTSEASDFDQGPQTLKEALRPIVLEILQEEMEQYLRSRG